MAYLEIEYRPAHRFRLDVRGIPPTFHAVLIREYRSNVPLAPEDQISVEALRDVQVILEGALGAMFTELIGRVRRLQGREKL